MAAGSIVVALVGDSDIERWPQELFPSNTQHVHGQSGATLVETLPLMATALDQQQQQFPSRRLALVFCAGENDLSQNIRLDETLLSFRRLLEQVVPSAATTSSTHARLVVLGPKFEPWLNHDASSRKQYVKLSQAMQRACNKYQEEISGQRAAVTATTKQQTQQQQQQQQEYSSTSPKVTFVDCLTMFCGPSGQQPGALLGGKAIAQEQYFYRDQLHLSREGYAVWKQTVEDILSEH